MKEGTKKGTTCTANNQCTKNHRHMRSKKKRIKNHKNELSKKKKCTKNHKHERTNKKKCSKKPSTSRTSTCES